MPDREGIRYHDETAILVASGNKGFDLVHIVNGYDVRHYTEGIRSSFE